MKFLLVFFILLTNFLSARDIVPSKKFISVGFVSDFVFVENKLYVSNDMGTIDIFDFKTQKIIKQIILPPLTSSMNKIIPASILSVDYFNSKILILSVGKNSYSNLWIYQNNKLNKIINEDKKLSIKEARFIDDEKIIYSTIGSDIVLFDKIEKYNIYESHLSNSAMQDFTLTSDKSKIIMSDESGEIKLVDVKSSKLIKIFPILNLDNVYKVASANGIVITAGQDRRVGVYRDGQKPYYIKSDFLVFCVGISPSGNIGVYSSGVKSDLQIFNTNSKVKSHKLLGHSGVVNQIKFISEYELLSSERSDFVLFWEIK